MKKPDCYKCLHRHPLPGDAHSCCYNETAKVTADALGIRGGWFFWPVNFDPLWLETCTGFEEKK